MGYSGANWLEAQGKTLSPFGREVADLLGYLYKGLYHLSDYTWSKVDWEHDYCIVVKMGKESCLATTDCNKLTTLVMLCHRMAIRCEIVPCNMQKLAIIFHKRKRKGDMAERHPTLAEAIASFEKECYLPGNAMLLL